MKSRLLVAAMGVPLLFYIVLGAPPIVMMAALCALSGVAAMELMQCVGIAKRSFLFGWTVICAVFSVTWYYDRPEYMEVLWFFSAFIRMEDAGLPRVCLLLPFIFSFLSDTGGYFGGRFFGKHKLAPKVSPKKTVEGSIGGLAGNVLGAVIFAAVMNQWFYAGIVNSYLGMILLGLVCSVVAQIGDLSFSLIKREFGIKDYGHLFLEHGGVLDRFDSVLFVTPLIEIVLQFVR